MRAISLAVVVTLTGCACPVFEHNAYVEQAASVCGWQNGRDPYVYDMVLDDRTSADNTVTHDPEFRDRLRKTIEAGADFWSISPWSVAGWRLVLKDSSTGSIHCLGGRADGTGCNDWTNMTITVLVGSDYGALSWNGGFCIESGSLIHEMGHLPEVYSDGDSDHSRPRWLDYKRYNDVISKHQLYGYVTMPTGVVLACQTHRYPEYDDSI